MLSVFGCVGTLVAVVFYAFFLQHFGWSIRRIGAIFPFISRFYNAVGGGRRSLEAFRDTFASKCRVST